MCRRYLSLPLLLLGAACAKDWGGCYQKAGSLCGTSGYDILAGMGDSGSTVSANSLGLYGGSVTTRSLVVACKTPGATS